MPCAEAKVAGARAGLLAAAALLVLATAGASAAMAQPAASDAGDKPSAEVLADSRFDNGVVAVVDGTPITLRELKEYGTRGAPFLPPEVREDFRALLDSMVERQLLKAEFEKHGVKATNDMVDSYITNVLRETNTSRAALDADLDKAGLTWDEYFERMREEVQRILLINLLIRSRVNVSEEEVKRTWEENPEFVESEKLVVAAIFLPAPLLGAGSEEARAQAAAVREEAVDDFEEAAQQHSKGPAAADGGVLGEFERGTMAAHFETALEGLDEGDVSEPVEGQGGYYIVKLVDIKSSGRRPFEEVEEELAEKIYENRLNERYKKWVTEDLRKDHRIDNLLDSLALIAAGGTPTSMSKGSSGPTGSVSSAPPPNGADASDSDDASEKDDAKP